MGTDARLGNQPRPNARAHRAEKRDLVSSCSTQDTIHRDYKANDVLREGDVTYVKAKKPRKETGTKLVSGSQRLSSDPFPESLSPSRLGWATPAPAGPALPLLRGLAGLGIHLLPDAFICASCEGHVALLGGNQRSQTVQVGRGLPDQGPECMAVTRNTGPWERTMVPAPLALLGGKITRQCEQPAVFPW